MEKKQKKIAALMQGHTSPFHVEYIVRAWDKTREGLAAKTAAIKNAINSMNGAQYLECPLPTHGQEALLPKLAGLSVGPLPASQAVWRDTAISRTCCPFSATFTGILRHAEALYDGASRNLVGITTFAGSGGNETPQHAVLLGMSGAGKSVTVCDLLSQTEALLRLHRHHRGRALL